jgi:hypothetical protein
MTPEGVPYPTPEELQPRQVPTTPIRPPLSTMPQVGAHPSLQGAMPPAPPPPAQPTPPAAPFNERFTGMPTAVANAKSLASGADAAMKDFNEKSIPAYNSAQNLVGRLDIIDHNIDALGPNWMGSGANVKGEFAKGWNSLLGDKLKQFQFDPNKVASWEDFNKETTRAGMELIKSNFGGSREAASIIQMGTTAVPSVMNTQLGAKYVSATIRAAAQREIDLHEYKASLAPQGGVALLNADVAFNKAHPPQDYAMGAITNVIPAPAKAHLISDPKLAPQFDQQFGPGTAEFILRHSPARPAPVAPPTPVAPTSPAVPTAAAPAAG